MLVHPEAEMSRCQCGMEGLGAGLCLHMQRNTTCLWWVVFTTGSSQRNFKQKASRFWPFLSLTAGKRVKQHREINKLSIEASVASYFLAKPPDLDALVNPPISAEFQSKSKSPRTYL